jgi:hypothetical protein
MSGTGYNATLGFGKFVRPQGELTQMTLAELQQLGQQQIEASRNAKEFGLSNGKGSSALGAYQFINPTREAYAKKLYGNDWGNIQYTPEVQDALARELYNNTSDDKMQSQWASWERGRKKQGWDVDKHYIMQRESAGTPLDRGQPTAVAAAPIQPQPVPEPGMARLAAERAASERAEALASVIGSAAPQESKGMAITSYEAPVATPLETAPIATARIGKQFNMPGSNKHRNIQQGLA